MATTFSRTLRALRADSARGWPGTLLAGGLVLAWLAWFLFGEVSLYEVTDRARLQVESAAHPLTTPVAAQVVETRVVLGQTVRAGEVLVALDAEPERRACGEARTRRDALAARGKAVGREITAAREALRAERQAGTTALAEARTQVEPAEARSRFATRPFGMLSRLGASRAASDEEIQQARSRAEVERAAVRSATLAVQRIEQDYRVQELDRQTRLAKLEREAVELDEEGWVLEATLGGLEHEIARRSIRAPLGGRVGEVVERRVGAAVQAGDKLGAIVPPGGASAVAWIPAAGVGRLRTGQPARIRPTGFPWTRYGMLPATVRDVGNEARDGRVRVELRLESAPNLAVPLEHGRPGSAEVEVERVSPAVLLLRMAGQSLGPARPRREQQASRGDREAGRCAGRGRAGGRHGGTRSGGRK